MAKCGKERNKDRQRDRKKDRMKERKNERWDKTVTDSVIKYMYITLNTTYTSACYILTNMCCTWLRMTRHIYRRNLHGRRGGQRERKTDREIDSERKIERKKERKKDKMRQGSDREW